ncbi:RidA family protein [Desulforhopalus sp. IMCC35007]|uniref:RidA family protein n=1 Tax=Desulforhopalus sp. IMCC35007 TaxID=2569543 RepID=UPI0010ADDD3F|nr:RidA family protein [Desulforhopalus sp. IMCC35007]TKB09893.1 RidA family protein [Desulforhopalus sp. IMCC35007]
MHITTISTENAPAAIGPYSQAVSANNLLFISGQLPIDPTSGLMVEGAIGMKTEQILKNAAAIAKVAGTSLTNVVKTTIFLTDLGDFTEMNTAYAKHFTESPPARSTVQVAALPLDSNIEIEFILAI